MKPVEDKITAFVHSVAMAWLLGGIAVVLMLSAYTHGVGVTFPVNKGLGLSSANTWLAGRGFSFFLNLIGILGVAGLMMTINSRFNLLRDITRLYAGIFLMATAALPVATGAFNSGTFMALVVLCCNILLFSCYNKPYFTRYIFLIFCIISAGALTQYAFIAYLPVFLIGCGQMRVFSPRVLTAALLGIVTPWWIAWSFGIIDFSTMHLPDFTSFLSVLTQHGMVYYLATVCITMVIGVTLCILNMIRVLNYNMRARSYNGFASLMLLATSLFILIDFTNISAYITLLNVFTAFQVAQFFVINLRKRSYIVVLGVVLTFFILYVWGSAI